jgi:hypothetical protein
MIFLDLYNKPVRWAEQIVLSIVPDESSGLNEMEDCSDVAQVASGMSPNA